MDRTQKLLVTSLWGLAVLAMIGVVGTGLWARRQTDGRQAMFRQQGGGSDGQMPALFDVPSFSLTDQNGSIVSDESLRGNVWVTMVFFSECPGVCPAMAARMTDLQKAVTSPDVKIVSFSIDPEHDTPEVMREYAQRVGADQSRWYFLTGPKPTMFEVARGLKLAVTPAEDGKPITHTQKVLLVDRANHVRGVYDTNDDDSMKQLAGDAQALAAEPAAAKGRPS